MHWHSAMLLGAVVDGRWRPGIGDPTFFGWLTAAAYLAAAVACMAAARLERRRRADVLPANPVLWRAGLTGRPGGGAPPRTTGPVFWWLLAVLLLMLGINKQLDLQSLVTQIGRDLAHSQGWYEGRAAVQKAFIVGVGLAGIGGMTVFGVVFRRAIVHRPLAVAGAGALLVFVVARAASFHHVDRFLRLEVAGLRWNWILELGGIGLVLVSALAHLRTARGR